MGKNAPTPPKNTASSIRQRIEQGGERVWRLADFEGLPAAAAAQALSRLAHAGIVRRIGKGLYYRPRQTALGESQPNRAQLSSLPTLSHGVFPSGIAAANLLGFSTQAPARQEVATDGVSLPRQLVGESTIIHTRRPEAWRQLPETDTALLDLLRRRAETSELPPPQTVERLLALFRQQGRYERITAVAASEPPRVRAMLGAIGQQIGKPERVLIPLRKSLNPLTKFDFGALGALQHAREWQAKEGRS